MSDWKRINKTDRKKKAIYRRSWLSITRFSIPLTFVDDVLHRNFVFAGGNIKYTRKHKVKS